MPEDPNRKMQIHGNVNKLTQIEHVEGNVIINSGTSDTQTTAISSLLSHSPPGESKVDLTELLAECRREVNVHLARISGGSTSSLQPVTVLVDGDSDIINQAWRRILEADTLHKRSVPSFVEGGPRNPPPKGHVADWVKKIQDIEFYLADVAGKSRDFDAYNTAAIDLIQGIWSPDQALLDTTGEITAPVLYFLTRLKIGEARLRRLAPKDASPFEPLLKFEKDGIFPIGLQENGSFLFATGEKLTEKELVKHLSTPPILTGLDRLDTLNAWLNQDSGELVGKFPKQRIDNRITNLSLQILAGHVALLRHLGYWSHVMFMYELLSTAFDSDGFASLLEVTSVALKQKRILANPSVGRTLIRLPSLDIISVEFDHSESIWYQENPIRATQITGREQKDKCLDPILDLQLINYSDVPCVVKEVIFRHYGTWVEVKAMPVYGLLESAHTYDIEVGFDKPISVSPLTPPLFIAPHSPGRFKLRLVGFRSKCPGSDTLIQLGLRYNNEVCDTPIFHMDIKG